MTTMTTETVTSSARFARRAGHFAIGTFAGICAAFVPRLFLVIAPQTPVGQGALEIFTSGYVLATFGFAVLVGGVILVFEWNGRSAPRDIFMSALAVPALLTGAFNTAAITAEVSRQAEKTQELATERARDFDVPIDDQPVMAEEDTTSWIPALLPSAHASGAATLVETGRQSQQKEPFRFGVRYREPDYWIVFAQSSTRQEAENELDRLGDTHGALEIKRLDGKFFVTLEGRAFAYSNAVDRAIEIKEKSDGKVTPMLVRAK